MVSASGETDGAGIGPAPFLRPARAARGAGVEDAVTLAAGDAGGAGPSTVGTMIGPSRAGSYPYRRQHRRGCRQGRAEGHVHSVHGRGFPIRARLALPIARCLDACVVTL